MTRERWIFVGGSCGIRGFGERTRDVLARLSKRGYSFMTTADDPTLSVLRDFVQGIGARPLLVLHAEEPTGAPDTRFVVVDRFWVDRCRLPYSGLDYEAIRSAECEELVLLWDECTPREVVRTATALAAGKKVTVLRTWASEDEAFSNTVSGAEELHLLFQRLARHHRWVAAARYLVTRPSWRYKPRPWPDLGERSPRTAVGCLSTEDATAVYVLDDYKDLHRVPDSAFWREEYSVIGRQVHDIKYSADRIGEERKFHELVDKVINELAALASAWCPGTDMVVAVPPSLPRQWDHVSVLAEGVAGRLGCRFSSSALRKIRSTPAMKNTAPTERAATLQGAFSAARDELAGRSVLVVDDLVETGSTIREVSRVIIEEGRAAEVRAVVCARVGRPQENRQQGGVR